MFSLTPGKNSFGTPSAATNDVTNNIHSRPIQVQDDPFNLKADPFTLVAQLTQAGRQVFFKKIAENFIGLTSCFRAIILGDTPVTPQAKEAHEIHQQRLLDYALHLYFNGEPEGAKQIWNYLEQKSTDQMFRGLISHESYSEASQSIDATDLAPIRFVAHIENIAGKPDRVVAQYILGQLYLDEIHQIKNHELANSYFQQHHAKDTQVKNIEEAAKYFLQSASQGYGPALDALKKLMNAPVDGNVLPELSEMRPRVQQFLTELDAKQQAEITRCNQEQAEQQQAETQMKNKLGKNMYQEGLRLEATPFSFANNHEKAIECYQHALKLGNADAGYRLGQIYKSRIGLISPSIDEVKKALDYHLEAVKLGHSQATNEAIELMFRLGDMHQSRIGLFSISITEVEKAKEYYSMAADLGHSKALDELTQLNTRFPTKSHAVN